MFYQDFLQLELWCQHVELILPVRDVTVLKTVGFTYLRPLHKEKHENLLDLNELLIFIDKFKCLKTSLTIFGLGKSHLG